MENSLPSATNLKKIKIKKTKCQFPELTGSWNWGYSGAPQSKPIPDSPDTSSQGTSMKCASQPDLIHGVRVNGTWQPVPWSASVTSCSSDGLSLPSPYPDSPCLLFSPSRAPCPALRPSELNSCPGLAVPCSCHLWFAEAALQNASISQQPSRPSFF